MLKRSLLTLVTLLVAGTQAQSLDFDPNAAIELKAGMSIPTGDGSEYVTNAFSGGATIWSSPANQFQAGFTFTYNRFGMDSDKLLDDLGLSGYPISLDGSLSIIEVGPQLRYSLLPAEQKVQPFVQFGAGMYFATTESEMSGMGRSFSDDTTMTEFGINLGGGLQIRLAPRARLVLAPSYHIIFTEDEEESDLNSGAEESEDESTKYFSILAALNFAF